MRIRKWNFCQSGPPYSRVLPLLGAGFRARGWVLSWRAAHGAAKWLREEVAWGLAAVRAVPVKHLLGRLDVLESGFAYVMDDKHALFALFGALGGVSKELDQKVREAVRSLDEAANIR
ncbi:hypothetical protein [Streptomyces sp. NBC_00696]|uniref:hypothetical protein n=1 Tax=Streptomyces sp. NBC_00696 TaxID=2903672 RepID=UPI002E2F1444|nr:hypothetical protein [Streptomyces sp. NBC_00696]